MENWLNIALSAGLILLGFATEYFKSRKNLQSKAVKLINEAESEYKGISKSGGLKFDWVVNELYKYIPTALKPLITKDKIKLCVQETFDFIQNYAYQQIDKITKEK